MLQPKRVKYRKPHAPKSGGLATSGNTMLHGEFGLKAIEPAWVTARQIEAARRAITHHLKRGGKVWIRIFPDHAVTAKPAETRMGSGKGAPDHWIAVVKPGRVMFEVAGVREDLAEEALLLAAHKLPMGAKFIVRQETITDEEAGAASAR
ncbi:MAG TPA: 50S ribosomal protein L16 [Beijerinckiaceae bacterium]|nr:50S ribosomal protein L16 [Beijerinckiaceae bacterium]